MKILQISNYYYPHIGGIEQVAHDISDTLGGSHEVKVFCFNHEKDNSRDEVDGVEIIRAGCFAKVASQSLSFSYGKLLKKAFNEFLPDVVIFHYPNPFAARYLLKILKKHPDCKLVLYWHLDITKQKILGKLFHGQNIKLLKRAIKVVATSPNYIDKSKYLPYYKDKCIVIPNCVSADRINVTDGVIAKSQEIKSQNQGKTICFAIGRHVPYKGMEYLVRAAKKLNDDYSIYIGGSGELTQSLKELAEGDDKVYFLGRISDEDVKAYLLACDIFCFPSITKNEAFGLALAEAMAYGKPAVTFTIEGSGVNYVSLNGVTGIEVPNCDVEAYAQAIAALSENQEMRKAYGDNALQRERQLFTFESFKENISNLIARL
jgi:glycosyltransferase involved in cell wall biosynthesis